MTKFGIRHIFNPVFNVISKTSTDVDQTEPCRVWAGTSLVSVFLQYLLAVRQGGLNPYHAVYLLLGLSFIQVMVMSKDIMQRTRKNPLTLEEHRRLRNSSILLGHVWSLLLYIPVGVFWLNDLLKIQEGIEVEISHYTPTPLMLLVILTLCVLVVFLTVSVSFWYWDSFTCSQREENVLALDEHLYNRRGGNGVLVMFFVFVLLMVFKSVIEGETFLSAWFSPEIFGWCLFLVIGSMGGLFWHAHTQLYRSRLSSCN